MSTDLVKAEVRRKQLPIGLLISTGAPKPDRGPGRPIDHFRFKAGALEQYAADAAKAAEVYGPQPKQLDDLLLLSNDIGEVLDIRVKAWGKSGVRVIGMTNYATLPPGEYEQQVGSWSDDILYFPRELAEVPKARRETWAGEPIPSTLKGPEDPRIGKYEMRIEATLSVGLPAVFGLGKRALYSTGSRHNRDQLHRGIWFAYEALRGNLLGVPFRLSLRPRRSQWFDPEARAWKPTQVYEIVLDTPWTIDQARTQLLELSSGLEEARLALPAGDFFADTGERARLDAEDALRQAAAGEPAVEGAQLRTEPAAAHDSPDDAALNRIAALEEQVGADVAHGYLWGVFGARTAAELTAEDADRYEHGLAAFVAGQPEDAPLVGEVVDEDIPFGEPAS